MTNIKFEEVITKEKPLYDVIYNLIENQQLINSFISFLKKNTLSKLKQEDYPERDCDNPFYMFEIIQEKSKENTETIKALKNFLKDNFKEDFK